MGSKSKEEIAMHFKKTIGSLFITTCLYGASTLVFADDIILENQSSYDLSFTMNHDPSKATGFIPAGTTKTIDEASFKESCLDQNNRCTLNINISKCDKEIGTVVFEETTVISVSNSAKSKIWMTGNDSSITFKNK